MKFITLKPSEAYKKAIDSKDSSERLLVCGSLSERAFIEENFEVALEEPSEIVNASLNIDAGKWFLARKAEMEEEWGDLSDTEGGWPGEISNKQSFTLDQDILSGKPLPEVLAIKLTVKEQWHIPAYLKFGGWNDCPLTDVQCSIWKYWQEKYGAVIVGAGHDVVEAFVSRPPKTKEEAMRLAWEQYLYCCDIVDQGVETVGVLAALLMNGDKWYFWWD